MDFFFLIYGSVFPSLLLSWPGLAQMLKYLPAMQETRVQCLGQEDPLEEDMATYSSVLAWRIPWTEEPGGLQSTGSQRVRHDRATNTVALPASPPPWPLPRVNVPSLLEFLTELCPCPSQWFWNSASSSQSAESLKVRNATIRVSFTSSPTSSLSSGQPRLTTVLEGILTAPSVL